MRRFVRITAALFADKKHIYCKNVCALAENRLAILAHEMTHLWQFHYGKPSRSGYHNKQQANIMGSMGSMPPDTAKLIWGHFIRLLESENAKINAGYFLNILTHHHLF